MMENKRLVKLGKEASKGDSLMVYTPKKKSINKVARVLRDLYEEIKHGDEEHQQWLKDKIENFIRERGYE